MKKIIVFLSLLTVILAENKIINLFPVSLKELNFSNEEEQKFDENYKKFEMLLSKMSEKEIEYEDLKKEDKKLYDSVDQTWSDYWQTITDGCNWYEGGGPVGFGASSYLGEASGNTAYLPYYIHDFSYKTSWVEGVEGDGIGEWIEFYFKNSAPATAFVISNGYVKNRKLYLENNRAKKLKLYINGEVYGFLNLKDICSEQRFEVSPIKFQKDKNYVLRFEIIEVYKGTKYDDTVISEINFDGIGVHCFPKGTKITMSDKSLKNIEDLKEEDEILSFNRNTKIFQSSKILKLEKSMHDNFIKYKFDDLVIKVTDDHPFLGENGWLSFNPEGSKQYQGFDNIEKIKIGDFISFYSNGILLKREVKDISKSESIEEAYTITKLKNGDTFIAEGAIVGVEE